MTREEYLSALKVEIMSLTTEEQQEALQYYSDYFDAANDDEKIINELGEPKELAKEIIEKFANVPVKTSSTQNDENNSSVNEQNGSLFFEFEPSRVGYRFSGWHIINKNGEETVKVPFNGADTFLYANDVTVEPSFELVEYSITYVVEAGGSNPNTVIKFNIESVIALLDATWSNDEKVFAGWFTSSDFSEESKITTISNRAESITLWAKFDDVEFVANSAKGNGGAIYNARGAEIGDITGNFIGNYAHAIHQTVGLYADGGAIDNYGSIAQW